MNTLTCHFLPDHVDRTALHGVVVVIDQLRASSTIVAALAAGASGVVPCLTPDDARAARTRLGGATLLGGERHGTLIDGFDLANSPSEYTPERVGERVIAFTTTNGTRALLHASNAACVLIGCLNNRAAVASAALAIAAQRTLPIHLLCAGTGGVVCLDDALAAGAIAHAIRESDPSRACDDTSMLVHHAFEYAHQRDLLAAMQASLGGSNLVAIGRAADVASCTRVDVTPVVPILDRATGMLTRWHGAST